MSLRTGILPGLIRSVHAPRVGASKRAFHFLPRTPPTGARANPFTAARQQVFAKSAPTPRANHGYLFGIGLGLAGVTLMQGTAKCAGPEAVTIPIAHHELGEPAPVPVRGAEPEVKSMVSVGQLSFGAVCGICAGVFVKKGFRALAFALGGVFVLLQYLSSKSYVTVDWGKVAHSYDGLAASVDDQGKVTYPTITGVINGTIDFLAANFQQRATFVAGFLLGIRIG